MATPGKTEMEFVSAAYEDIWGRSVDSLYSNPESFTDAIHDGDRDRVLQALQTQEQDPESYDETYRVVQPDGDVRWVHDRAFGSYSDNGQLERIIGVVSDITERKESERELEAEKSFIEQSLGSLEDVFYVLDTDGYLDRWNDSFVAATGYTDTEIDGMHTHWSSFVKTTRTISVTPSPKC